MEMHVTLYDDDLEGSIVLRNALDAIIETQMRMRDSKAKEKFGCGCKEEVKYKDEAKSTNPFASADEAIAQLNEQMGMGMGTAGTAYQAFTQMSEPVELPTEPPVETPVETSTAEEVNDGGVVYTKDQIKEAAGSNAELATLAAKKGRKSAVEQARVQELTAAYFASKPVTDKVGEALKGMTAQQLHEMLGTQTQIAPVQPAADATVVPNCPPLTADPLAALAAAEAAAQAQTTTQAQPETPAEPAPIDLTLMSRDALFSLLQETAEQENHGLQWFIRVVNAGGGVAKMTADHIRDAIVNPTKYCM